MRVHKYRLLIKVGNGTTTLVVRAFSYQEAKYKAVERGCDLKDILAILKLK